MLSNNAKVMDAVRAKLWPECTVKTYMEYLSRLHAEKPPKSLFHLGMDDGIGGGFVKDGVCFIGDSNQGMEIGHIVIAPNGPLCQCGNRGCLEAVAGETGIRRRIREALNRGITDPAEEAVYLIRALGGTMPPYLFMALFTVREYRKEWNLDAVK